MPAPTAKRVSPFHPFTGRDVPWLVDTQASTRPDKLFLVWESPAEGRREWTFAAFAEETRAYAAGLVARGVKQGDFVLLHMDNCPEFLFAWYACARVGAVVVTTNTRSAADELGYFIAHSGSTVAITQPKYAELVREVGPALRWIACTERDCGEPAKTPRPATTLPFEELRGDPAASPTRVADPLAMNSVQYTSGTTSRPKGVVWTHANALWSARVNATHARLSADDVHMFYFPLFHTNALAYSVLATLWSGGTAVMVPKFSASRFWDIAVRNRCTWASMNQFTLRALEGQPDPEQHWFRFWAAAGDMSNVRKRWGIKTVGWYGMTETISQCTVSDHEHAVPEGTMGWPAPEYELSIRRDDGSEVEPGETGRLWIRGIPGLSLFLEYLHDPDATARSYDSDGWFDTGDEVLPTPSGAIFFVSRAKDMLKVGGENVAAIEIEVVIAQVPGVVECAVVGKPDPMLDEVPVAFVVAQNASPALAAEIEATCAARLADFKRPREVRFLDQLPKGLLDKVLKKDLRAMLLS